MTKQVLKETVCLKVFHYCSFALHIQHTSHQWSLINYNNNLSFLPLRCSMYVYISNKHHLNQNQNRLNRESSYLILLSELIFWNRAIISSFELGGRCCWSKFNLHPCQSISITKLAHAMNNSIYIGRGHIDSSTRWIGKISDSVNIIFNNIY